MMKNFIVALMLVAASFGVSAKCNKSDQMIQAMAANDAISYVIGVKSITGLIMAEMGYPSYSSYAVSNEYNEMLKLIESSDKRTKYFIDESLRRGQKVLEAEFSSCENHEFQEMMKKTTKRLYGVLTGKDWDVSARIHSIYNEALQASMNDLIW